MSQFGVPHLYNVVNWLFKKSVEVNHCLNDFKEVLKVVNIHFKDLRIALSNFDWWLLSICTSGILIVAKRIFYWSSQLIFYNSHWTLYGLHDVHVYMISFLLKLGEHNVFELLNALLFFVVNVSEEFIDISSEVWGVNVSLFFLLIFEIIFGLIFLWVIGFSFIKLLVSIRWVESHHVRLHRTSLVLLIGFSSQRSFLPTLSIFSPVLRVGLIVV